MKGLTEKQDRIYKFIETWQVKNGFPPTQDEIRNHFGYRSINTVRNHLSSIEKKGYIQLNHGKARGIRLLLSQTQAPKKKKESIPLLGAVAAGVPIWAEQNFEDFLPIPPTLFGKGELFALRVVGDSMNEAGIRHGDIAVIQRKNSVENGEIAAVLVDNEATLKRVYAFTEMLVLKSENPAYKDLKYDLKNTDPVYVLGSYKGIMRIITNRHSS